VWFEDNPPRRAQLLDSSGKEGQTPRRSQGPDGNEAARPAGQQPERRPELEWVTEELGAYLRGWKEYFKLSDTNHVFFDLDQWIHRRLRAVQLKQWKRGRTVYRELRRRDVPEWLAPRAALFARSWWRVAGHGALHTALPGIYFERIGVPPLAANTSTH
jgi:hypothetical protein